MSTPAQTLRPLSIERKVQAGFTLALACLVVIGVVSFQSVRQLREDQAAIDHTHEVIAVLRQVEALINAAESAQRGHTITGDESFLDAYKAAKAELDAELARVRQLTADNAAQQRELDVLEPLVSKRMAVSRQVAETRRREGFPAAQTATTSGVGRALHGQVVALLGQMEQAERTLLVGREARAQRSATRTQAVIIAGGGLALAAVGLALALIRRDFAGSRRAEAALRTAHDELEARVAARTAELRESEARLRIATDNARVGLVVVSPERRYLFANAAYAELLGLPTADLVGQRVADVLAPVYEEQIRPRLDRAFAGERVSYELRKPVPDGALHYAVTYEPARSDGSVSHVVVVIMDITERKRVEALLSCQMQVLEMIATGAELPETLTALVRGIEAHAPGMLGSILLLDEDGVHVRHGAAPSLPDEFNRAVAGQAIGPAAGSCGTAAFRREAVIVEDIAADPLWQDYRELALRHGLCACWSTPIFDEQRRVLGTFAIYNPRPGTPSESQRECIGMATHLAAVAIARHREAAALRESEERLRLFIGHAPAALAMFDRGMRYLAVSRRWVADYALGERDVIGRSHYEVFPEISEAWQTVHRRGLAGEVLRAEEDRFARADGTVQWLRWEVRPWHAADGVVGGIVIFAEDITARKRAEAAVQASEQRLRGILDTMFVFVGLMDPDGRIVEVNEAPLAAAGLTRADVLGRAVPESHWFSHSPTVQEQVREALARAAQGQVARGDYLIRIVGGQFITIDCTFAPLRDASGRVAQIVGSAVDITERKLAEESLREAEARLRLSVAASNIGLWDWNLATNEVFFSPEWKAQLGHADHEISNQFSEWESRVHPDDLAPTLAKIKRFLAEPAADYAVEFRLRHKDGSYRWIFTQANLLRDATGKPVRMLGCHLDITERKRSEATLRQSEERFATAFRASPVGICLTTLDEGRFLDANDAFLKTIGFTREEVVGHTATELNIYVEAGDREALVSRLRERGTVSRLELRFRRKSGELGDSTRSLELVELGGERFILTYFEDITERKRAEAEVLASREQLRALLERLQRAQEEERTRMAREIHDELGQLLTGLKMDTRWLERKLAEPGVPATFAPLLDRAVAASELADTTITAVRKLAAELRPGALDHLGLAAALAERARLFAERTGVHCTVTAPEPPPALPSATATELFYICQEALTNVARHAQASVVVIQFAVEGGAVLLTVSDDGAGVGEVDWNRPQSLGLVGMRERALHCGGTLNVGPNTPRGTKVAVRVPLTPVPTKGETTP